MKVAFISRSTLYLSPGGDTRQIDMTAKYLRVKGVDVDIFLANQSIDYKQYDLLHFFNIIRPADILGHIFKSKKPYVVSTIFLDYGDFEKTARAGAMKWLNKFFSADQIEYIKVIARRILNGEKISSFRYLWIGQKNAIKYIANHASVLLPNSENEYKRLQRRYGIESPYHVIPNGIDTELTKVIAPKLEKYKNAILCVARIEGRKNQLNLVRALNGLPYKVYIIGKPSPNNQAYYDECKRLAANNIFFQGYISDEELQSAYASAKIHILPSYFETTGLSSLEAAVVGCNIVVSDKGDTMDYFKGFAWFCDPDNLESIRFAVNEAFNAPYNVDFRDYILSHYTWEKAADETLLAYHNITLL